MKEIAEALDENDWERMRGGAHSLKGASGYVGAGRIHYCCYHMQKAYNLHDFQAMVSFYPMLVESAIEFKRYSRSYLAMKMGKFTLDIISLCF